VELIWLDSVLMDRRVKQLSKSRHSIHTLHNLSFIQTQLTISPKSTRPDPSEYINPPTPDPTRAGPPPALPAGYGRWREYVYDPNARVIPGAAWAEGGSLAGWRSGGILSVNARDRGGGGGNVGRGGGGGGGGGGGFTKDLSTILCFVSASHLVCPFRRIVYCKKTSLTG